MVLQPLPLEILITSKLPETTATGYQSIQFSIWILRNFLENIIITFSPSAVQSEMGQPWSAVEKGQAPLEMWRYQKSKLPGQSSNTYNLTIKN